MNATHPVRFDEEPRRPRQLSRSTYILYLDRGQWTQDERFGQVNRYLMELLSHEG